MFLPKHSLQVQIKQLSIRCSNLSLLPLMFIELIRNKELIFKQKLLKKRLKNQKNNYACSLKQSRVRIIFKLIYRLCLQREHLRRKKLPRIRQTVHNVQSQQLPQNLQSPMRLQIQKARKREIKQIKHQRSLILIKSKLLIQLNGLNENELRK